MKYWHLTIECPCGEKTRENFLCLLITSNSYLAFAGVCKCGKKVMAAISLEKLLVDSKDIPDEGVTEADREFLASMKISLEEIERW